MDMFLALMTKESPLVMVASCHPTANSQTIAFVLGECVNFARASGDQAHMVIEGVYPETDDEQEVTSLVTAMSEALRIREEDLQIKIERFFTDAHSHYLKVTVKSVRATEISLERVQRHKDHVPLDPSLLRKLSQSCDDLLDLPKPTRARSLLKNLDIKTIEDLVVKTEREILNCYQSGPKTLAHIKQALAKLGLRLDMGAELNLI